MTNLPAVPHELPTTPSQIRWQAPSWGAIIAGVCVAVAAMVLFGELCSGIGWGLVHAQLRAGSAAEAMSSLANTAIVTCLLISVVALFAGGWTAGHLAKRTSAIGSVLHGVIVWALGTLLVEAIGITSLGLAIGGSLSMFNAALRSGLDGGAVQGTAARQLGDRMRSPPRTPEEAAARSLAELRAHEARMAIARAFADLEGRDAPGAGHPAVPAMSEDVDPPVREPDFGQEAIEQARDAAAQATSVASGAAYVAFIATVLGLVAAAAGGTVGGMAVRKRLLRAERAQVRAQQIVHARLSVEHP